LAATVAMARIDGVHFGIPRNVDTRLLHYRTDLFDDPGEQAAFAERFGYPLRPPQTWDELADAARHFTRPPDLYGYAFPGQESGLWGQFYELVESAGGRFFAPDLRAGFDAPEGVWALDYLRRLYGGWAAVPPETPDWRFDAVSAAFDAGRVAMIGDWPASYGAHAASAVGGRFDLALYPAGPDRRAVYSGGFTWAIPRSSRQPEAAMRLALHLSDERSQKVEARQGTLVPRLSVQAAVRSEAAAGSREERRLALLEETVRTSMLVPPRFAAYPEVERAVWPLLQAGFTGTLPVNQALREAAEAMDAVVAG
jgi:multiple sugar transport system substrate-binding protein